MGPVENPEQVRGMRYGRLVVVATSALALGSLWLPASPQSNTARRSVEPSPSAGPVEFYIRLGIGDPDATRWDGSVRVTGGRVTRLETWPSQGEDRAEGQGWKVSTHRLRQSAGVQVPAGQSAPEAGLLLSAELAGERSRLEVSTAQGNFSFAAVEIEQGLRHGFLAGRATVERVPVTTQITNSPEEQDYPSVAQSNDSVFVAYVEFTPGDRAQRWPPQLGERPRSFELLARPTGGDQVRLVEYSKGSHTWGKPYAVSGVHQDVYRTAAAVDGEGRVWVFWAANVRGNYDIFARYRKDGSWSEEMRLTDDPGPDLNPVAVTDTTGAVWLAWQGYRRDNFDIFVARQRGGGFAKEERVSISSANDWDPQIAAGKDGEVAVAWNTYDKGDYDVYLRRMRYSSRIGMDMALPIAATQKYEAKPSVAYDRQGRIWVAYEESFRRWGKAFGTYATTGSGLYQGSTIRLKVINGHEYFRTLDKLEDVIEAPLEPEITRPASKTAKTKAADPAEAVELPEPDLARNRAPGSTPYPPPGQSRSFPRLASDDPGIIFLAYRAAQRGSTGPQPSTWLEHIVYYDCREWLGPELVPHSDNTLDNQPALISTGPGDLLVVHSSDHRLSSAGIAGRFASATDASNNDLYGAELRTRSLVRTPQLVAIRAEAPEAPETDAIAERDQIAALRAYRARTGRESLQLLRGDFQRYTEWSDDGARDGPLTDAYRYMIDAAGLDWSACCDHDDPSGREYSWWTIQKLADVFHIPGRFVPMFGYDRSAGYPEGSRSIIMARRGVRPLPRLAKADGSAASLAAADTQMLYDYLRRFDATAAAHSTTTALGTDWGGTDSKGDPKLEPLAGIYEGNAQSYEMPGAPRAASEQDAIGGWQPLGFLSLALQKGYRMGFGASSGHISTHMAYANLWVTAPTRAGVMDALRKRRVYASTDSILADVSCDNHFMGEEFRVTGPPMIRVKLIGTADFNRVHMIKDGKIVYTGDPKSRTVDFGWPDKDAKPGTTSYYYIRGEQTNGEMVWSSPMWITIE